MKTTTTITKINLLLIGFILLNISAAKAWNQGSELNLKLYDNSLFSVYFDQNSFQYPDNRFTISNVKPGKHFMKIVKHVPGYRGGMLSKVVYNGWITVPFDSKVYAVVGRYNDYKVTEVISLKPAPCGNGYGNYENTQYNYGQSKHGRGNGYGHEKHGSAPTNCGEEVVVYNTGGSCAPSGPAYLVMSDGDFCALKNTVANASFDNNKLLIAKQALANNYLTAAQVAELADLMTFESNKLEFAKCAYKYTIDKNHYYMVNNVFSFSSSVNELNKYISSVG